MKVKIPVISIGNLTLGGTGKTPVTHLVLQYLVKNNKKVALISRAYKAKAIDPVEVEASKPYAAQIYGDEAVMLAKQNPKVRVFVGQNKRKIAEFICSTFDTFDVLVIDDGFQHRALHRNLDLVLLDATEPLENYNFFPKGRAREGLNYLARADLVIFTKTNLVYSEHLRELHQVLPNNKANCSLTFDIGDIKSPVITRQNSEEGPLATHLFLPPTGEPIYLVAGVAKPSLFIQMFRKKYPLSEFHLIAFNDHHDYNTKDVQLITHRTHLSPWIVTTQKDWVKLKAFWPTEQKIWVADLEVRFESGKEIFFEKLDQCLR